MVYLDTSVFLRVVFKQPGALSLSKLSGAISSELLVAEALRSIDRIRFKVSHDPEEVVVLKENVFRLLTHVDLVAISRQILNRVASPFSTPLATLGAIHLSTAILWRERFEKPLTFLTHDRELEMAARSEGFDIGV